MANARRATMLVVALLVGGIMAAFLLPVAINAMAGAELATFNQSVSDDPVTLQGDLTANVTAVNDNTNATYTIADNTSSTTVTVAEGSNKTVTVDGTDVTVALQSTGTSNATTEYEYPTTYGWGNGAGALWAILPVIVVLAVFLFFTAMALGEF